MANSNVMDYVTIGTAGNATDFGNLTAASLQQASACSIVRGLIFGGSGRTQAIDYITIATAGNAADFGDSLNTNDKDYGLAIHNKIYAYYTRRYTSSSEKHTIATAANATALIWNSQATFGETIYAAPLKGWIAASG